MEKLVKNHVFSNHVISGSAGLEGSFIGVYKYIVN